MTELPPMPLEWHPAYRDKTWLLEWLNGGEPPYDTIELPLRIEPRQADYRPDLSPMEGLFRTIKLTRRTAWGLAPYVGRPFAYRWTFATDDVGRSIASDSEIIYQD